MASTLVHVERYRSAPHLGRAPRAHDRPRLKSLSRLGAAVQFIPDPW